MRYQQNQLDAIWALIKDHQNLFAGEYTGLVEVGFDLPLSEFTKRNRLGHKEVVKGMRTMVSTRLDKALRTLHSANIRCHHLSCAADTGVRDNSALCIHYINPEDDNLYSLAIPGVNYVPTQETLAMLRRYYS